MYLEPGEHITVNISATGSGRMVCGWFSSTRAPPLYHSPTSLPSQWVQLAASGRVDIAPISFFLGCYQWSRSRTSNKNSLLERGWQCSVEQLSRPRPRLFCREQTLWRIDDQHLPICLAFYQSNVIAECSHCVEHDCDEFVLSRFRQP